MRYIEILSVGLLATVQDAGRPGFLRYGITEGGAVDDFSRRLGQRLLGNPLDCAALEIGLGGLSCRPEGDCRVAVTGATAALSRDGHPLPMNTVLALRAGQTFVIGPPEKGIYSYLSVGGGVDVTPVLGSRSTVVREGIGGIEGRSLRAGDRLPVGPDSENRSGARAPATPLSPWGDGIVLRYLPGFQSQLVAPETLQTLERGEYKTTGHRDRMGARVDGPRLHTGVSSLWSEATCLGAIQVPPDGQPIVLLNDRQTVGGYPKLGAVVSTDCVRLAQAPVGTPLRFRAITPGEADRILWLHRNYELEMALEPMETPL